MARGDLAHLPLVPPARLAAAMSLLALLLGALLGAGAGWLLGRRRPRARAWRPGVSPHLLPDPALEWLRRAHGATGVWVAEMDSREGEPHAERMVDAERLSVAPDRGGGSAAGARARSGAERGRADGGRHAGVPCRRGIAVGLLLPGGSDAGRLDGRRERPAAAADGVRRRPQMVAAGAGEDPGSLARIGGERGTPARLPAGADARCAGRRRGVRERRTSCRARRPPPNRSASSGCRDGATAACSTPCCPPTAISLGWPAARWTRLFSEGDPLGGVVADRRQRPSAVLVLPMRGGRAHAWAPWRSGRRAAASRPAGPGRRSWRPWPTPAPRVVTALEADRLKEKTRLDPLTGLLNRRGLDVVLNRVDVGDGALIYADLDRFKQLNDTLGHPAGDAALMHFARIIREQIRDRRHRGPGRWGGVRDLAAGRAARSWRTGSRSGSGSSSAPRPGTGRAGPGRSARRSAWPACPETSREVGD